MRFLLDYHHLTPDTTVRHRPGLTKVLEQLQGLDLPAGAWEKQIIAQRLPDLVSATHRLPDDIERALWNGVALGLFTADGFAAVRALLNRSARRPDRHRPGQNLRSASLRSTSANLRSTANRQPHAAPGRWSLVAQPEQFPSEDLAEAVAQQLLACFGVVFRDLAHHPATPTDTGWRDILKALRRFEDRGLVRGGRFVAGQSGEQFALPAAADQLQTVRRPRTNQQITIAACDPLNLTAILFEGPRTPATPNNTLTYTDGLPTAIAG